MDLVTPNKTHCRSLLEESREVLLSFFSNEIRTHCRSWMTWNRGISRVITGTLGYTSLPVADEAFLKTNWNDLMLQVNHIWGDLVQAPVIQGEDWEDGAEEEEDEPEYLNDVDVNII